MSNSRRTLLALQVGAILLAGAGVLATPPPALVERYYSDWFYPALQSRLTSWSNQTGVSLFDFLIGFVLIALALAWMRWLGRALRARTLAPIIRGSGLTLTLVAVLYLWFLLAWGLSYAREPLEDVVGFDRRRVTPDAVVRLAERATREVNQTYSAAHAAGFPGPAETPPALVTAMHDVERRLGRPAATTPSRPKHTLLRTFFRAAGVDGMHAPFLLETLLNPDLTGPERPAVLAHEWAHLAGYGPEDDASFVGLLAALRADPASRYSAWLTLFDDVIGQLPTSDRQRFIGHLEAGPRADREAIIRRLRLRVEAVQRASWETYDRYLKAQGVTEGIQSYSRVVQLLLGSGALDW